HSSEVYEHGRYGGRRPAVVVPYTGHPAASPAPLSEHLSDRDKDWSPFSPADVDNWPSFRVRRLNAPNPAQNSRARDVWCAHRSASRSLGRGRAGNIAPKLIAQPHHPHSPCHPAEHQHPVWNGSWRQVEVEATPQAHGPTA